MHTEFRRRGKVQQAHQRSVQLLNSAKCRPFARGRTVSLSVRAGGRQHHNAAHCRLS